MLAEGRGPGGWGVRTEHQWGKMVGARGPCLLGDLGELATPVLCLISPRAWGSDLQRGIRANTQGHVCPPSPALRRYWKYQGGRQGALFLSFYR